MEVSSWENQPFSMAMLNNQMVMDAHWMHMLSAKQIQTVEFFDVPNCSSEH
jgi:hypothetical protein